NYLHISIISISPNSADWFSNLYKGQAQMTFSETGAQRPEILVTGGAGVIGSHVCVELIAAGFVPVVVDSLCNSKPEALKRVAAIAGSAPVFHEADINDKSAMRALFARHNFAAVMHFAGLKAVGESGQIPLKYYRYNVA